jgi:FixJ family two-component response regulator
MGSTRNTYVAVVDDDESICRAFGRLLRAAGFQPISYPSAEAFLEDHKHPQFDCLVLDIQLSGMSGIDLKKQLDASGSATPVIYITAFDDPDAHAEALATGCAGYFRKADSGTEVLEALRRAVSPAGAGPGQPTGAGRP